MPETPFPEIELLSQFTYTLRVFHDIDRFADVDGLAEWLREQNLVGADDPVGADDLRLARGLREALREALLAHHDGESDAGAMARLDALAADLPLRATFSTGGEIGLEPVESGTRGALARVVAAVVEADAQGRWERLKLCWADDCAVPFYDKSRNHSRRWCEMAVCGSREKSRAYRARQAAE